MNLSEILNQTNFKILRAAVRSAVQQLNLLSYSCRLQITSSVKHKISQPLFVKNFRKVSRQLSTKENRETKNFFKLRGVAKAFYAAATVLVPVLFVRHALRRKKNSNSM